VGGGQGRAALAEQRWHAGEMGRRQPAHAAGQLQPPLARRNFLPCMCFLTASTLWSMSCTVRVQ
jgi:hypothetical protein